MSLLMFAGYFPIMIALALLLTVERLVARNALERPLTTLDRWLSTNGPSTTALIIGLVDAVLPINAWGMLQSMQ